MIILIPRDNNSILKMQKLIKKMKNTPKNELVCYTVPICLVKPKILHEELRKAFKNINENEYCIVIDFATYIKEMGNKNDSPHGKNITIEEHEKNCDKLIEELRGFYNV